MAIHVQDEETDRLVREFARRRGVGITAAIKLAVTEATGGEKRSGEELLLRIAPILEEARAHRKTSYSAEDDKAFMDEMWGEDER
ncbi:MAG: transcription factor [Rhizobiaceae bacterium]|nr:MAG: transcription factor [Rhizobiaceae bacterium]CAG0985253.1 hypothetical protein RHIZO_01956 [Rhizobiaceae bacterium]